MVESGANLFICGLNSIERPSMNLPGRQTEEGEKYMHASAQDTSASVFCPLLHVLPKLETTRGLI